MAFYYDKITGQVYDLDLPGQKIPSITDDYVLIDGENYFELLNETYQDSSKIITFDAGTSGLTLSDAALFVPTNEYLIKQFYGGVYNLMDREALSFGYGSVIDAISYYNSGITAWRDEAIAFNTWRDNTVSLMYDNIFSFTADGTPLPDIATGEFTGQAGYFDVGITASRPNLFS